jgi:ubiquitin C-terminal hydrolase
MTSSVDDLEQQIKEIEKTFLEDLYNLNVEDLEKLEKVATIKDINDYILDIFTNTSGILNRENKDLESIYKELQAQASSPKLSLLSSSSSPSSPSPSPSLSSSSSTSSSSSVPSLLSVASSSSSSLSSSSSSNSSSPIQEGLTSSIQDNIKDIATDTLTSEVVKTNVKSIATNTVKKSVGQKEENTIEDQIKNSALEAVRYNIELEKEKSYAGAYPRKKVGVSNPRNACYAIASIQMLYSLPFLRKYYIELEEENFDDMQYDFEKTLKLLAVDDKFNTNRINARNNLTGITIFFKLMNVATNPTLLGKCSLITHDTQNQQDVNEYLVLMRPIYIYNDAFRIFSYEIVTCENGSILKVPEKANAELLSLEIMLKKETEETKKKDLNSCIESFNDNNDNEYHDRCKNNDNDNDNKVDNVKRFYIIPPENRYLLILLKRSSFINNAIKITDYVEPNKTLIIGGVKYTLSGVIVHRGILNGGHYIYIQCDKDGVFTTIYDDERVRPFNEYKMDTLDEKNTVDISQSNKNFINQNGYIFAYTRYPVEENNPVEPKPLSVLTFPP